MRSFITALYTLSEHCNYGALTEEMIRDRIVVGLRDSNLSLNLQLDEKLDLHKAITQVHEAETIKQQQPALRAAQKETTASVSTLHRGSDRRERRPQQQQKQVPRQPVNKSVCGRCGKSPSHDRQHCPAKDAACRECGKRGHYKVMCRSKKKVGEVYHETASNDYECDEYEDVFFGSVNAENDNPWLVSLQLEGKLVEFHIDTGAEVSVIPEPLYEKIGSPVLTPVKQTFRGASNAVMPIKGRFSATLSRDGQQTKQEIYVAAKLHKPLLGQPAIKALGIVRRVRGVQVKQLDPVQQFPKLFTGLGKL